MVKLERITDDNFPLDFFKGKRIEWELELLTNEVLIKKQKIEKHLFKSNRWKAAKEQLINETNGRCAYCEVRFNAVAYGDVEHYRPKSIYWWLAYSYDNYLPSCQLCNQKYKKDKFPLKNKPLSPPKILKSYTKSKLKTIAGKITTNPKNKEQGYPYTTFLEDYISERPYCINPYYEDPSIYFKYTYDDNLREVKITSIKKGYDKYLKASEEVYGINRKELKEMRYKAFFEYRLVRSIVNSNAIDVSIQQMAKQALKMLLEGSGGFIGMLRYFEKKDINRLM